MAKRGKTVKKVTTITETIKSKPAKAKVVAKVVKAEAPDRTNKLLLDNFIGLQEALTNIGYETKELNKKLTAMLDLFETASRNFQEHPENRNLSSKIDELIEQNRIIAKSLLLMHKTTKESLGKKDDIDIVAEEKPKKEKPKEDPEQKEKDDEDVSVEKDDSESTEDFKPEPLPEFNF